MKNFSTVNLNTKRSNAVVGAGVRLGQFATEVFRQGRRAVPHGTIKNVGVAGNFSHRGYGYQSRAWGLALDSICILDVGLADLDCCTSRRPPIPNSSTPFVEPPTRLVSSFVFISGRFRLLRRLFFSHTISKASSRTLIKLLLPFRISSGLYRTQMPTSSTVTRKSYAPQWSAFRQPAGPVDLPGY